MIRPALGGALNTNSHSSGLKSDFPLIVISLRGLGGWIVTPSARSRRRTGRATASPSPQRASARSFAFHLPGDRPPPVGFIRAERAGPDRRDQLLPKLGIHLVDP